MRSAAEFWRTTDVSTAEAQQRAGTRWYVHCAKALWRTAQQHCAAAMSRQSRKRLRVDDTVSLGEKRFVAILRVDGEQFLLGGSSANVVLLARLCSASTDQLDQSAASFGATLERAAGNGVRGHGPAGEW